MRYWTGGTYQWFAESSREYHKGEECPYNLTRQTTNICQEGYCNDCGIREEWLSIKQHENKRKGEGLFDYLNLEAMIRPIGGRLCL